MCAFRKRKGFVLAPPVSVVDVATSEDGKRRLTVYSEEEYLEKYPPAMEEYSLTEELQSGVLLKEIPCGNLIGSNDPLDHEVDENQLLERVNAEIENNNQPKE